MSRSPAFEFLHLDITLYSHMIFWFDLPKISFLMCHLLQKQKYIFTSGMKEKFLKLQAIFAMPKSSWFSHSYKIQASSCPITSSIIYSISINFNLTGVLGFLKVLTVTLGQYIIDFHKLSYQIIFEMWFFNWSNLSFIRFVFFMNKWSFFKVN
jgi:hypothetical protein